MFARRLIRAALDPLREVVIVKTSADPLFDDHDHENVAAFRAIARTVAGD